MNIVKFFQCIVVRGQERDSLKLFAVRQLLLNLETDELNEPPLSPASAFLYSLGAGLQEHPCREMKGNKFANMHLAWPIQLNLPSSTPC